MDISSILIYHLHENRHLSKNKAGRQLRNEIIANIRNKKFGGMGDTIPSSIPDHIVGLESPDDNFPQRRIIDENIRELSDDLAEDIKKNYTAVLSSVTLMNTTFQSAVQNEAKEDEVKAVRFPRINAALRTVTSTISSALSSIASVANELLTYGMRIIETIRDSKIFKYLLVSSIFFLISVSCIFDLRNLEESLNTCWHYLYVQFNTFMGGIIGSVAEKIPGLKIISTLVDALISGLKSVFLFVIRKADNNPTLLYIHSQCVNIKKILFNNQQNTDDSLTNSGYTITYDEKTIDLFKPKLSQDDRDTIREFFQKKYNENQLCKQDVAEKGNQKKPFMIKVDNDKEVVLKIIYQEGNTGLVNATPNALQDITRCKTDISKCASKYINQEIPIGQLSCGSEEKKYNAVYSLKLKTFCDIIKSMPDDGKQRDNCRRKTPESSITTEQGFQEKITFLRNMYEAIWEIYNLSGYLNIDAHKDNWGYYVLPDGKHQFQIYDLDGFYKVNINGKLQDRIFQNIDTLTTPTGWAKDNWDVGLRLFDENWKNWKTFGTLVKYNTTKYRKESLAVSPITELSGLFENLKNRLWQQDGQPNPSVSEKMRKYALFFLLQNRLMDFHFSFNVPPHYSFTQSSTGNKCYTQAASPQELADKLGLTTPVTDADKAVIECINDIVTHDIYKNLDCMIDLVINGSKGHGGKKSKKNNTPGRTRTYTLSLRRRTPYPIRPQGLTHKKLLQRKQ
jgi:hypothetical protein